MTPRSLPRSLTMLVLATVAGLVALSAMAPGPEQGATPAASQEKPSRFIGAAKCKSCHGKEETGDQYGKWQSEAHSKAYEVLGTARAKEVGAAKGIADPQKSEECLRCHVTAHGAPAEAIQKGFDPKLGVQCESCHGPGERHLLARFREAKSAGEGYPDIPAGEIVSATPVATCQGCHNPESPTYKPFCPHERLAEIRHLNPKKPRTPDELAALTAAPCPCEAGCVCKSPEGTCRSAGK